MGQAGGQGGARQGITGTWGVAIRGPWGRQGIGAVWRWGMGGCQFGHQPQVISV